MKITNLTDALTAMKTADIWTWTRGSKPKEGSLTTYHDDFPNDLRTVHSIRFSSHSIRISRRALRKYDTEKKCWNEFLPEGPTTELETRVGEKRLREFIANAAREDTGLPNPMIFTAYPKESR